MRLCLLIIACLLGSACGRLKTDATHAAPAFAPVRSVAPLSDANADGLPDGAELRSANDRANFRQWLTGLAEQQFYELSESWNPAQRDCAGLVRFAWRESLRRHDRLWFQKMGAGYQSLAPDVAGYDLDKGLLGEKLFRTRNGTFQPSDIDDGTFSEYADAGTLRQFNATFISRDPRQAQAGDLLFYFQPWTQKYPYHVMIFLGAARRDGEGAHDWVVYHTGGSAQDKGEVRKVRLATLAQHPNPRWRPVAGNDHFLGFYRLKILQ